MSTTTRFAPSPTGFLHLGHVYAAQFARQHAAGGRFLLRLEDIDTARCRPAYAVAIEDDLRWLGLAWNGPVRVQSDHSAEYSAVLDALCKRGLLYPCFCSRADIAHAAAAPHGPEGPPYPGTCRALPNRVRAERLAAGDPHAWRLDTARAVAFTGPLCFIDVSRGQLPCDPAAFGDVVLGRRDVAVSYHLCATYDEAAQGVQLVTRGEDLLAATSIQRLLQALMGWPEPRYAHHPLLLDGSGRRLSKRDGACTVRALREAGHDPAAILAMARP